MGMRHLTLVSAERQESNRLLDRDAIDPPTELRLVKDGFQQAARGARRHDGIAHTLHFHFRPGKAGEFPQVRR